MKSRQVRVSLLEVELGASGQQNWGFAELLAQAERRRAASVGLLREVQHPASRGISLRHRYFRPPAQIDNDQHLICARLLFKNAPDEIIKKNCS